MSNSIIPYGIESLIIFFLIFSEAFDNLFFIRIKRGYIEFVVYNLVKFLLLRVISIKELIYQEVCLSDKIPLSPIII